MKDWRMKVKKCQLYFPPAAATPKQLHLNTFLCTLTDTIVHEKSQQERKSEIGFTIDHVSPLLKYIFPAKGVLSCKWERSSTLQASTACKKVRTDLILIANGQEVGCGEIKTPCPTSQLLEEDRSRIAETLKRQLHARIMKSKDVKEFFTFGIIFDGFNIELYMMIFDFQRTLPYQFYYVERVKLPTSFESYNNMEETIEYLLSFKNLILSSLAGEEDMHKPYAYHNFTRLFKPTIAFIKD
ncbi:hypothetical protein J3Q64DRAFT_1340482 [Phycomyces blakesleeanus]